MQGRPVNESVVIMTELVLPIHTNSFGSIFGGQIMSWIDIAGAICAQRHSQSLVVTASIDDLHFIKPVFNGWVVNLKASVNFVSSTSMEVGVRVDAENPSEGATFHTASAYLTFVALDKKTRLPKQVPPVIPETEDQKARYEKGRQRRELRLQRRQLLKKK